MIIDGRNWSGNSEIAKEPGSLLGLLGLDVIGHGRSEINFGFRCVQRCQIWSEGVGLLGLI